MSSKTPSGLANPAPSRERTFADNAAELRARFGYPDKLNWNLKKGKKLTRIKTDDPIATATLFASIASAGYASEKSSEKGYVRMMADGTIVVLRVVTSSEGSPAVDLNIIGESHVRKIHFYKGEQ